MVLSAILTVQPRAIILLVDALRKSGLQMVYLTGPRMYYSLFGAGGLFLGAKARILRRQIEVSVKHAALLHPLYLRLRTTDVASCREILIRGQYECHLDRTPRVIVDGGANIGLAAVFYANRYPGARIIALEPESSNYTMLRKNVAPYPNVSAVQAALWSSNTEVDLIDLDARHTTFQTRETAVASKRALARVKAITIDRLIRDFDIDWIDLLKIDIEGAEKDVFEFPERWISRVGVVAVELHDYIRPGSTETVRAATRDFSLMWQHGETSYWARKGLASPQLDEAPRSMDKKFPLEIVGHDAGQWLASD